MWCVVGVVAGKKKKGKKEKKEKNIRYFFLLIMKTSSSYKNNITIGLKVVILDKLIFFVYCKCIVLRSV